MKIRLYFDEDSMSRSLVRALRSRGIDVETALDAEMIERRDAHHLDYAALQDRVQQPAALCEYQAFFHSILSRYTTS